MTRIKYRNSGDGYYYNPRNPSKGGQGMPPEEYEKRKEEFIMGLYAEIAEKRAISSRAEILLMKYSNLTSREEKIKFLEEIMKHKGVKVKGGFSDFRMAEDGFIHGMYMRTINGLKKIIENPLKYKDSKLVERIFNATLK